MLVTSAAGQPPRRAQAWLTFDVRRRAIHAVEVVLVAGPRTEQKRPQHPARLERVGQPEDAGEDREVFHRADCVTGDVGEAGVMNRRTTRRANAISVSGIR